MAPHTHHPHKNQFILNFVFCFILLFSLNTSLKSACTSDVDMGGYDLINVGEIIFVPKEIVEFNGNNYVNWAVMEPENTDEFIQCTFQDNEPAWMLVQGARTAAQLTALCPEGFSFANPTADYARSVIEVIGTGRARINPGCIEDTYLFLVSDNIDQYGVTNSYLVSSTVATYWGDTSQDGGWLTCVED